MPIYSCQEQLYKDYLKILTVRYKVIGEVDEVLDSLRIIFLQNIRLSVWKRRS